MFTDFLVHLGTRDLYNYWTKFPSTNIEPTVKFCTQPTGLRLPPSTNRCYLEPTVASGGDTSGMLTMRPHGVVIGWERARRGRKKKKKDIPCRLSISVSAYVLCILKPCASIILRAMALLLFAAAAVLLLVTTFALYSSICLLQNYLAARKIGVPVRIIPVDHINPLWYLISQQTVSLLKDCHGDLRTTISPNITTWVSRSQSDGRATRRWVMLSSCVLLLGTGCTLVVRT